jgi:hypothetical protein
LGEVSGTDAGGGLVDFYRRDYSCSSALEGEAESSNAVE